MPYYVLCTMAVCDNTPLYTTTVPPVSCIISRQLADSHGGCRHLHSMHAAAAACCMTWSTPGMVAIILAEVAISHWCNHFKMCHMAWHGMLWQSGLTQMSPAYHSNYNPLCTHVGPRPGESADCSPSEQDTIEAQRDLQRC